MSEVVWRTGALSGRVVSLTLPLWCELVPYMVPKWVPAEELENIAPADLSAARTQLSGQNAV